MVIAPRAIRSNSEFTISLAVITESIDPITFRIMVYERLESAVNKSLDYVPNDKFVSQDPHNSIRVYGPAVEPAVKIVSDSFSADNRSAITDYKVKTVTVWPNATKLVSLKFLTDVLPGNYNLDVESLNISLAFHENYFLYVESKAFSMFIETDRAIFKPGDVMRYRVLVVDSDTKPINVTNGLTMSIFDSTNNLVHLRTQLSAKNGVFAGNFETKVDDVLGIWEIEAQYKNQRVRKSVECSDQEVPNFQVIIKTSQKVGNLITVAVEAQYLFGKPVRGVATVSAIPILGVLNKSWARTAAPVSKTLGIDGSITVNFTLPNNLSFNSVLIEASVLNVATDVYVNATDKMIVSDTTESDFEISVHSFDFYLPGLPYTINVTVASKSGRPLSNRLVEFLIAYDEEYLIDSIIEEYQLDANGEVAIVVQIPDEVSQTVQFQVRYAKVKKDISFRVKNLHAQVIDTAVTESNRTIRFQVGSRTPLSTLFYYVVGRGNILLSTSVDCKGQNFTILEFDVSFAMAPNCSLVVFYIAPNGTIVSDYTSIAIAPDRWLNPVSI
jgi:CD109 antigen